MYIALIRIDYILHINYVVLLLYYFLNVIPNFLAFRTLYIVLGYSSRWSVGTERK